ncbi:FAD-binding oxidoreductase [Ilyomonas limi]|uniref:FAD-binding oxidoreductase n=1 Tax=Ilyomonas limi TaxID=2575867 RepID=A0A4U3LA07_9BACT|nr:FAD-binding oxidoreductase [Ilyomonas limi]TKK71942.1 FAD-binding oxidoreductase [Ilyomonas limi]
MNFQIMIDEFINAIGRDYVIEDKSYIHEAELTNYKTSASIALVLMPGNTEELRQCILIAKKYKQPVYTVSRGKNWGYGSRVPVTDNNVLIELKRLNRIVDFDEKHAYITVEPGVTFDQVFDFLREKNSELIISSTGGNRNSSMLANALERGIGTGLYAERFSNVCGLEVLLPNGDIIATSFERYGNYKTGKLFRWGLGPTLDGLFSQSNMGIVTKMTLWLMKTPPHLSLIFYKVNDITKLKLVIDELQLMAMEGLVRPTITLYNDIRIITSLVQYPFNQYSPEKTDADELMRQIKQSIPTLGQMVGDWNGEISIRAENEEHAAIQYKIVQERLKNYVEDFTITHTTKEEILKSFQEHYNAKEKNLAQPTLTSFLIKKYTGIPDNAAIRQTYWRKRSPMPADLNPDRDKCGLIWICPVVPFSGEDVLSAIAIIKEVIKKYAFEPAVSLQCTTERCINVIASFCWDREVAGEDEMAEKCYFEVSSLLNEKGYFSYRGSTLAMSKYSSDNNAYDTFVETLKNTIDPDGILSPGRYVAV